ncbi:hypothetical protein O9H85_19335 [Paenibacillus filicis]|uniref:DUF4025 domain-containing protein n=1 Tax=Paenibacillus gyeongsangnamensis TaxID=3388067 RepID=A0ABT4QCL9_9BACL|nr:hypothetical protein [Paenibacillus filicis]MCZ8514536.1 hypothetical protein [Paenibacillus filicis]
MTNPADSKRTKAEAHEEPTIAPGMNTHDPLEERASEEEVRRGEATEVTRLYVDRTPED